jgi:hypothetical protein
VNEIEFTAKINVSSNALGCQNPDFRQNGAFCEQIISSSSFGNEGFFYEI